MVTFITILGYVDIIPDYLKLTILQSILFLFKIAVSTMLPHI